MASKLSEVFVLDHKIAEGFTGEAFAANDRLNGGMVKLWVSNVRFTAGSDGALAFESRLSAMRALQPVVIEILNYGIDAEGVGFLAVTMPDGVEVGSRKAELFEAERQLVGCLRLVSRLHSAGILMGDISSSSFITTRGGDTLLAGSLGYWGTVSDNYAASGQEVFLAPELRVGGAVTAACDIYALGVLVFHIITGGLPTLKGSGGLQFNYPDNAPSWAKELVQSATQLDPADRFKNAEEMLSALSQLKQKVVNQTTLIAPRSRSTPAASTRNNKVVVQTHSKRGASAAKEAAPAAKAAPTKKSSNMIILLASLLIGVGGVLGWQFFGAGDGTNRFKNDPAVQIHGDAAMDPNVPDALAGLEKAKKIEEKKAQLRKLIESDDPVAHDILIRSAKEANTQELRAISEDAILERAQRLGLTRSVNQVVKPWLRTIKAGEFPPGYEAILRSLDGTLPVQARVETLRTALSSQMKLMRRLVAAMAFDTGDFAGFQPLMADIFVESNFPDAKKYSLPALVGADPELAIVYGDDFAQSRERLTDNDLSMLMTAFARRSDSGLQALASLALTRGLVPPLRAPLIKMVRDRTDLDPEIAGALVKVGAGSVNRQDLGVFGRWMEPESERTLLVVLAESDDPKILGEAFDLLSGKSVKSQPALALVEWIRRNQWQNRQQFAKTVGVFANLDKVSEQDMKVALGMLDNFASDRALLKILVDIGNVTVTKAIMDRFSTQLGVGGLLGLLKFPAPEIRISAIKALKQEKNIAVIKLILDAYEEEKDPQVRRAYKENIWAISERPEPGTNRGR